MQAKEAKILNLLSMAQKARKIAAGTFAASEALKKSKAFLLIIASDAKKKEDLQKKGEAYGIPCYEILTKDLLGKCIGKENIASIAVLDKGFARALVQRIEDSTM